MVQSNQNSNAIVVEGGAMRGIFAAGVLDSFIEQQFYPFNLCIGVSAGANNLAAYLAGMHRCCYKIYTDYMLRADFINWMRFARGGSLLDLDWLWDITKKDIFTTEINLNRDNVKFVVVATEVATGRALYLEPTNETFYSILKAGCAMPIAYKRYPAINGKEMTDGGVADPLPVIEAANRGAKNIMVIRSRDNKICLRDRIERSFCQLCLRERPKLLQSLKSNYNRYQQALDFIANPPSDIRIIEIQPPQDFRASGFSTNLTELERGYLYGYQIADKAITDWKDLIAKQKNKKMVG